MKRSVAKGKTLTVKIKFNDFTQVTRSMTFKYYISRKENLMDNVVEISEYFKKEVANLPGVKKVKGKGLMLGLEFDFEVGDLRKKLIYDEKIFTGGAMNKKLLRILNFIITHCQIKMD